MNDQLIATLRGNFIYISLGVIILAAGLSSLAVYLLRSKSRDKLSLWLGFLACLYGLRLIISQKALHVIFNLPESVSFFTNSFINYSIFVPAMLFFRELYGGGWKNSFTWFVRATSIYFVLGVISDVVRRQPFSMPDPAVFWVLPLLLIVGLGMYHGYRPLRSFREIRPAWIGYLLFLGFVLHEHLSMAGLLPWAISVESGGFLIFICCLGYVAVRRFLTNEQHLVAIDTEMKSARQIQSSILPAATPRLDHLRIAVRYEPMTSVAGDFYDFLVIDDRRIGLLVADVTGHGVPAAMIASMVKVGMSSQATHAADPARVISGLNEVLCQTLRGQLVTAGYLFLDLEKMIATYAGAGHPPLILFRSKDKSIREFEQNGLPLGFLSDAEYCNLDIPIEPGDRILLYTDGLTEAANGQEVQFGEILLNRCIEDYSQLAADDFADLLLREVGSWSARNGEQSFADDLTFLVADVLTVQNSM